MRVVIYISILSMLFSCKKEEQILDPNLEPNQVQFQLSGSVNGNAVQQVNAGDNDYYMYATHYVNSQGIRVLESELKKNSCSSVCPNSYLIRLSSHQIGDTSAATFDDSVMFYVGKQFNYTYTDSSSFNGYIQNPNEVIVTYTNATSQKKSSRFCDIFLASSSTFTITSVENFGTNELGLNTKKIGFNLTCFVQDTVSSFNYDTLNLSGTFAFAYPTP